MFLKDKKKMFFSVWRRNRPIQNCFRYFHLSRTKIIFSFPLTFIELWVFF